MRPYVGLSPTTPHSDAGCRTLPPVSVPNAHTASPAATAAAEPPLEIPGIVHGSVRGVLVRRAHRKLVAVGLADQDGARAGQACPGGRIVGRDVALEDLGPARGADAVGREHVLDGDGDARHG